VLALRLVNRQTRWQRFKVNGWYGLSERLLQIVSSKAICHHPGRFGDRPERGGGQAALRNGRRAQRSATA
jgi:hypothetical protein